MIDKKVHRVKSSTYPAKDEPVMVREEPETAEASVTGGGTVCDYMGRGFDAERAIAKLRAEVADLRAKQDRDDEMIWKQSADLSTKHYKLVNEFQDFQRDFGQYVQDEAQLQHQGRLILGGIIAAVAYAIGRAR